MTTSPEVEDLLRSYSNVDDEDLSACQVWMSQCLGLLRGKLGPNHPTVQAVSLATASHLDPKAAYRKSTPNNRRRALEACRAALAGAGTELAQTRDIVRITDSTVTGNVVVGGSARDIVATSAGEAAKPRGRLDRAGAFVSYMRDDQPGVDQLVHALTAAGVDVWIDRADIRAGDRWKDRIAEAITANRRFLVCLSAAFVSRPNSYMHRELAHAIRHYPARATDQAWLIPVRLDDSPVPAVALGPDPSDGFMNDLHAVDWFVDPTRALAHLLRVL